jgi:hypothetical protein
MVCGDMGSWARKHTGTADEETLNTITEQIANAQMYYDQLVSDKEAMKQVPMNKRKQAQMLGILFAEYQILTTEQASIIRNQMDKPTYAFEEAGSLWAFYNYVTIALQISHPKTWMEDQRILHYFISSIIGSQAPVIPAPVVVTEPEVFVDPNQTNLLDQIAEVEAEEVIDHNDAINEVMAQSLKDDLVYGMSGIVVTEDTVRNASIDEVLQYTDPAGNTFEAPVVPPCVGHDAETEKDLEEEILATEVENFFETVDPQPSLEPTPEEYEEANLDLIQPVIEPVAEMEEADFDLDFVSTEEDDEDEIGFEF